MLLIVTVTLTLAIYLWRSHLLSGFISKYNWTRAQWLEFWKINFHWLTYIHYTIIQDVK